MSRKTQKTQKTRKTQKTQKNQKIKIKDSEDPSNEVRPFLNKGLPNEIVCFQLKSGVCVGGGKIWINPFFQVYVGGGGGGQNVQNS